MIIESPYDTHILKNQDTITFISYIINQNIMNWDKKEDN